MEHGSSVILTYAGIVLLTGVILISLEIYNRTKKKHEGKKTG
jgi:hypothetical protein